MVFATIPLVRIELVCNTIVEMLLPIKELTVAWVPVQTPVCDASEDMLFPTSELTVARVPVKMPVCTVRDEALGTRRGITDL
jgi:hypothetical protein